MAKPTRPKMAPRPITPLEPKGYEAKRVTQRIQSQNLFEELDFDPRYVPWMYVDNVIQRAFALCLGQSPMGPRRIKCTDDGALYVAGIGGAYTRNVNKAGAAPDAYAAAITFTNPVGRLDVFTYDNQMVFKRSFNNIDWDDEITLFKDSFYSFDCVTKAFNVKNKVALSVANYTAVGWF